MPRTVGNGSSGPRTIGDRNVGSGTVGIVPRTIGNGSSGSRTIGNGRRGFGTVRNRRSRPGTVGVGCGMPVTVWSGHVVRRERAIGDLFVTSIGWSGPGTVGNGRRGFWALRDGRPARADWLGSVLGGDRTERVEGTVTSVCWNWENRTLIE